MKLLHVVQGYTPAIGGTELLIQKISEQLVYRYDDEVTVFTTNAAKNCELFWSQAEPTVPVGVEQINEVTVRRFPVFNRFGYARHRLSKLADLLKLPFRDRLRALFNGPIIFGMTQEIVRFQADVVVASSFPFLHMHYALMGGKRSGKPVVLHGALHPLDTWGFDRPMIYQAIGQADAYIANSRFEQDYLLSRNISASKSRVIGVGVDYQQFSGADGQTLRQQYGWGQDPVVAFVGHLSRRKGIDSLLAAMVQVWAVYPAARLLLAGSRNVYAEQLEQEAAKLAPAGSNRVIIKSNFPESEKAEIFAACDILVLPSIYESFGIVFLEAWACHKPVIGMRAGAIPSIIDDGVDGWLVTPDNPDELAQAISQLLTNPAQRAEMGQAGYNKLCRNYTWNIVADRFREVYTEVTSMASLRN